jgi:alpha-tubulin suppressor-like RCC1 family protein
MKDIENSKKEAPLLGLQGMGGGVGGFNFLSASGEGGGIWGWGANRFRLYLNNDNDTRRSSPVQIGTDTNWTLFQMGTQANAYAAINSDNELYTWGNKSQGQLGQNNESGKIGFPEVSAFPGSWNDISTAMQSMCAIKDDNTLWVWGENRNGHLGINIGSYNGPSSPTQIPGSWSTAMFGGSDGHVCGMGVKTDGTLWTWGKNSWGKLGFSSPSYAQEGATRYSSPVQVGTDTTWGKEKGLIAMGDQAAFAIKTNGTLWAWGNGYKGVLGDGVGNSNAANTSPKQIGTNTNWAQILTSGYGLDRCNAVKTNNTMWTWGQNEIGILGLNNRAPNIEGRSSPTQIPGTNWKIGGCNSLGVKDTAWVKEDGTLWSWGYNSQGSGGWNISDSPGYGPSRSSPTQIGSGTDWLGGTGGLENVLGAWGAK